ncbi:MAG: dual specificity protein phosphatase family protein [Candidatus Doudnabacteria bacterium]|nr:dual specificity protein phosphatase family protein [Candidatus Doudnabacteria bacterium]
MIEHSKPNFNQVTQNIWIGNNMCCQLHGSELIKLGFDADIDLEDTRAEEPPHTKIYLWLPTVNHTPPSMDQLAAGVAALKTLVERNLKVYVHCQNGHGRAPTLVAAYFVSLGQSVEEAIAVIKAKRPAIHLQDSQIEALKEFQRKANLSRRLLRK